MRDFRELKVAEACGRDTDSELTRFLTIAMESASESEYLFLLSSDLNILNESSFEELTKHIIEIKRMLTSFILKPKADS